MMIRRKVEDGDTSRTRITDNCDKEDDGQDVRYRDVSSGTAGTSVKTPKKQQSNRSFKPASNVLDSVRKKYRRLKDSLEDDGFSAEQFDEPEVRVPYRAILLAVFLLMAGSAALTLSLLSLAGHIAAIPNDGPVILMALGLLMFVPGFYHVRIAVYAFQQRPGFSFDDIPDFS